MSDAVERRAEERGEMKADIKHLVKSVNSIKKTVDNLDCTKNTKKIDEMYITHSDNKALKQHIAKTILTQLLKASGFVAAGATAVYAYFK